MKTSSWIAFLLLFLRLNSVQAQLYSVTDLGGFGASNSEALGINDSGTVVGYSGSHAFSWTSSTGLVDLGTLGGSSAQAYGINSSGVIVGVSEMTGNTSQHAFSYSGGVMADLGTLGGNNSIAYAINNAGTIVGESNNSGGTQYAFSYSGGVMTNIMGLPSATLSSATGINSSGVIVGNSDLGSDNFAFMYSGGVMTSLGDNGGNFSQATGINDSGVIVGIAGGAGGLDGMSYLGGVLTDIGHWGASAGPNAINDAGDMVGNGLHAEIYSNGVLTNLNTLLDSSGAGWNLIDATGINDEGQIVGYGSFGGKSLAFLLTPTPEPSACALLVVGMGILSRVVRRRHS